RHLLSMQLREVALHRCRAWTVRPAPSRSSQGRLGWLGTVQMKAPLKQAEYNELIRAGPLATAVPDSAGNEQGSLAEYALRMLTFLRYNLRLRSNKGGGLGRAGAWYRAVRFARLRLHYPCSLHSL